MASEESLQLAALRPGFSLLFAQGGLERGRQPPAPPAAPADPYLCGDKAPSIPPLAPGAPSVTPLGNARCGTGRAPQPGPRVGRCGTAPSGAGAAAASAKERVRARKQRWTKRGGKLRLPGRRREGRGERDGSVIVAFAEAARLSAGTYFKVTHH